MELLRSGPLTKLRADGYSAPEARKAGYSAQDVVAAGYSADELKAAGYTAQELETTPIDLEAARGSHIALEPSTCMKLGLCGVSIFTFVGGCVDAIGVENFAMASVLGWFGGCGVLFSFISERTDAFFDEMTGRPIVYICVVFLSAACIGAAAYSLVLAKDQARGCLRRLVSSTGHERLEERSPDELRRELRQKEAEADELQVRLKVGRASASGEGDGAEAASKQAETEAALTRVQAEISALRTELGEGASSESTAANETWAKLKKDAKRIGMGLLSVGLFYVVRRASVLCKTPNPLLTFCASFLRRTCRPTCSCAPTSSRRATRSGARRPPCSSVASTSLSTSAHSPTWRPPLERAAPSTRDSRAGAFPSASSRSTC